MVKKLTSKKLIDIEESETESEQSVEFEKPKTLKINKKAVKKNLSDDEEEEEQEVIKFEKPKRKVNYVMTEARKKSI